MSAEVIVNIIGYSYAFMFDGVLPLDVFEFTPHAPPRIQPNNSNRRQNQQRY
ncbi:MAG: hypothetical protein ABR955_15350 [Verrucomicrobiota bacterium]|jgi:hypothetical protein